MRESIFALGGAILSSIVWFVWLNIDDSSGKTESVPKVHSKEIPSASTISGSEVTSDTSSSSPTESNSSQGSNLPAFATAKEIIESGLPLPLIEEAMKKYTERKLAAGDWKNLRDELMSLEKTPTRLYQILAIVESVVNSEGAEMVIAEILPSLTDLELRSANDAVADWVAERSPREAIDLALKSEDKDLRLSLVQHALGRLAEDDPVAAAKIVDNELKGSSDDYFLGARGLVEAWVLSDPDSTYQWIDQISTGLTSDAKDEILYSAATVQGEYRPWDAIEKLDKITNPGIRTTARRTIYQLWSESDPARAAAEAAADPDASNDDQLIMRLATEWSSYDASASDVWLNNLMGPSNTLENSRE